MTTLITALARVEDRISALYVEHCAIECADGAIQFRNENETESVPAATLSTLLLGPGTRITHAAISLAAKNGCSLLWTGENMTRFYAGATPLSTSTRLLERQAMLSVSPRKRIIVARKMFQKRFPDVDVSNAGMKELLSMEGHRVKKAYAAESDRTGVPWFGRQQRGGGRDDVNTALSAAGVTAYGIVQSIIVSLGCSPALGFIHRNNQRAFVFDIADLYRTELLLPLAFDMASKHQTDIASSVRHELRDRMLDGFFMKRCVNDILDLLEGDKTYEPDNEPEMTLWAGASGEVLSGWNQERLCYASYA
ncbi:type I-E CRISPR-associated endonuclease Cas1e [Bifidobacterium callitrichidarum]|uniref:CRISPR-associated endonuclease Cas1 n=1 Tax=Bifidobacterium callitrichidarum TaxID=2052941 RepID=A0A2U2NC02_9BIFI|nr:type I-E CRISPR-associated endonuclease Cas1e [Bifidobacterium callitrichidarum]PWG66652.1 type I-E CRISPR-associated endonuclease Cas1 [Bifidobacterium callitrichidarum]